MNTNEIINNIVQNIKQPLWGSWYIKEKIRSEELYDLYKAEARRSNRTDISVLKIQPITADGSLYPDEAGKRNYIENRKKFAETESDIMYKLRNCGNIVTYEDEDIQELFIDGNFEGYYFLIRMEYLTSVSDMLRNKKMDLSEANVLKLAKHIGQGIRAAHYIGVLHRDIKPDNFFVSDDGTYKLGNFRLSERSENTGNYAVESGYTAPEVYYAGADKAIAYTRQADIYSFGLCLYQLMNGLRLPFEESSDTVQAFGRRMSGEALPFPRTASDTFGRIILKACAYNISERYGSMDEMLRDLEGVTSSAQFAAVNVPNANGAYNNRQPPVPPTVNYNNRYFQPDTAAAKSSNHTIPIIIVTAAIVACIAAGIIFAVINSGKNKSDPVRTAVNTSSSDESEDIYDPGEYDEISESVPEESDSDDISDKEDKYDEGSDHTDERDTSRHEPTDSIAVEPTENTTATLSPEQQELVQHDLDFTPFVPENSSSQTQTSSDMGTNNADIPQKTGLDIITGTKSVMQAFWMDITKGGDFEFNGEYMTADFRIKKDAGSGIYPVTIEYCDASNYNTQTIKFSLIDGAVVVGGKAEENTFDSGSDTPQLMVTNVSGKPGDTVTVRFMIKNNPGIVGNIIRFGYNSDALEYVGGGEGADFDGHFR